MIHRVLMPHGNQLANHDAWMMLHPALEPDCSFLPGDLVALEEGIFVLNEALNPMALATDELMRQAQRE